MLNKSKILNCGYGRGISVKQVANEFARYANKNLRIVNSSKRKGDLVKIIALTNSLNKFIKWKLKYNSLKLIKKFAQMGKKSLRFFLQL